MQQCGQWPSSRETAADSSQLREMLILWQRGRCSCSSRSRSSNKWTNQDKDHKTENMQRLSASCRPVSRRPIKISRRLVLDLYTAVPWRALGSWPQPHPTILLTDLCVRETTLSTLGCDTSQYRESGERFGELLADKDGLIQRNGLWTVLISRTLRWRRLRRKRLSRYSGVVIADSLGQTQNEKTGWYQKNLM